MNSRRQVSAALIGLLVLVAGGWFGQQALRDPPGAGSPSADRPAVVASAAGLQVRALSQLPPQAAEVWQLVQRGGPFPYRQDGAVFGNREGRLPKRQSGFYREYTVPTPGESDRGARRLITGRPVTSDTAELYYTGDHYESFVVVDPRR
ncbi:MAG TPA: ribonuclease domain-containing protein [Pseudonocardiaceae bacterium]|jgi:ribonuclease T1|nr:ribonuclease domain-containing protein [Pseudonocardiaceae bacterium]